MLMLQAYIDDSGSDKQGPVYVLSGYIAKAEEWAIFAGQWDKKLRDSPRFNTSR
jgi:hypothetical protein